MMDLGGWVEAVAASLALPAGFVLPVELGGHVERHHRHLANLVASLRAAGLDDHAIDGSIGQLVESYRAELSAALRSLVQEEIHG